MKRRQFSALAALASTALTGLPVFAQNKSPMRILVGFPPGGALDTVARLLADKLRVSLNQNVIVENKPGAAGRIALGEVKRAAPDGNTVVLSPGGALAILPWLYSNLGYDPVKDFTPIARVTTLDFALTIGPGAPQGDVKALFAWMKANPQKAMYATSGAGSVPHFAGLLIGQALGIPMIHVAYRGGAPAVQDLVSGQVPLMIDSPSETLEFHRSGKVRIVAVTGGVRSAVLPDVPTLKESGVNVAVENFFGIYGPAGLPKDTIARLNRALADALSTADVQEKIKVAGLTASYAGPDVLAATQAMHYKRWEEPIKASGFVAE